MGKIDPIIRYRDISTMGAYLVVSMLASWMGYLVIKNVVFYPKFDDPFKLFPKGSNSGNVNCPRESSGFNILTKDELIKWINLSIKDGNSVSKFIAKKMVSNVALYVNILNTFKSMMFFIIDSRAYFLPLFVIIFVALFIYYWVSGVAAFMTLTNDRLMNNGKYSGIEMLTRKIPSVFEFGIFIIIPILSILIFNKFREKILVKISPFIVKTFCNMKTPFWLCFLRNNSREFVLIGSIILIYIFGEMFFKYLKRKLPNVGSIREVGKFNMYLYLIVAIFFNKLLSVNWCSDPYELCDAITKSKQDFIYSSRKFQTMGHNKQDAIYEKYKKFMQLFCTFGRPLLLILYVIFNASLFIVAQNDNMKINDNASNDYYEKEEKILDGLPDKYISEKKDIDIDKAKMLLISEPSYKSMLFVKENGKNVAYFFSTTNTDKDNELSKKYIKLFKKFKKIKNNDNVVKYYKQANKDKYKIFKQIITIIIFCIIVYYTQKLLKANNTTISIGNNDVTKEFPSIRNSLLATVVLPVAQVVNKPK
jgi:hypothetical protein